MSACSRVSEYRDSRISLRYADYDVERFAAVMKQQEGKLFRAVHTKVLVNESATRANVLKALQRFLGQASSEDVVMVFLSGYSVRDKVSGQYYFLPYDVEYDELFVTAMQMSNIDAALRRVAKNVKKLLIFLDTCHSGSMEIAMKGEEGGVDVSDAFRQLLEAEGIMIISSSKPDEYSKEDYRYRLPGEKQGHGAFTYAILKGLRGEADQNRNNVITAMELMQYVNDQVPKLTEGLQHPYLKAQGTDIPLFILR